MASLHKQSNTLGTTWRVRWREDGKQHSLSFETELGAQRFKDNVDQYGPEEARRVLELEEKQYRVPTVEEFLTTYIDSLTGVQPATVKRYRSYASRDIAPRFGSLPITAVTEDTIGRWVQEIAAEKVKVRGKEKPPAAKTIQNKHGFLSGAFKAAVRKGLIVANPCEDRRLPEGEAQEMVCLTPGEFQLLHDCLPKQWQPLATWLVSTGMRFSEATALKPSDIDPTKRTCRINKAWKYSGDYDPDIGPPKTKKSNRTITLSLAAMDVIDLTQPEYLFTNGVGNPVRAQEFFNNGWKPAREKAQKLGLTKSPRVHDLRHTHASWLINANTPLPVVQARLGHENISTTIGMYYHVDQRAEQQAAATIQHMLTTDLPPALQ
jgi:integrase